MKIMLDASVLLSALLFPDMQTDLLLNTITKDHTLVMTAGCVEELKNVTRQKFPDKTEAMGQLLFRLPYQAVDGIGDADVFITDNPSYDGYQAGTPKIVNPAGFLADIMGIEHKRVNASRPPSGRGRGIRLSLSVKMLFRAPVKTFLTFLLLTAVMYALLARVSEYTVTAREFRELAASYRGIGLIEISSPQFTDITWSEYLTSNQYNPGHPDGTWEDTRYAALTPEQIAAVSALPHVTYGSARYMTAGVSDRYTRPSEPWVRNQTPFHNYVGRVVMEGTYLSTTFRRFGAEDQLPNVAQLRGEARMTFRDTVVLAGGILDGYIDTVWMPTYWKGAHYDPAWHIPGPTLRTIIRNRILTELMLPYDEWEQAYTHGDRYLVIGRGGYASQTSAWVTAGDSVAEQFTDVVIPLAGLPENYLETEAFADVRQLIDLINQDQFTFDMVYTDSTANIPRFGNGSTRVVEGRGLTPEDAGGTACVVSLVFARQNRLAIGDRIVMFLGDMLFEPHIGLGALAVTRGRFARPVERVELEIVGIYDNFDSQQTRGHTAHWSYSSATIFVPLTLLPGSADTANTPVKPGAFNIVVEDARQMAAFRREAAPILEQMGLTLHFFDGGWLEIERELLLSQRISLIAIVVLVLAVMAAVTLVVFLFILQKKQDFAILRATGCPKHQANLALFLPLLVMAAASVATGSAAAWVYNYAAVGIPMPPLAVFGSSFGFLGFLCALSWFGLWRIGQLAPLALLQNAGKTRRRRGGNLPPAQHAEHNGRQIAAPTTTLPAIPIPPVPTRRRNPAPLHCFLYILRGVRRSWVKSLMTVAVSAMLFGAVGQFAAVREAARALYETMPVKIQFKGFTDPEHLSMVERSRMVHTAAAYKELAGPSAWTGRGLFRFLGDDVWQRGRQADLVVTTDIERYYGIPVDIELDEDLFYSQSYCVLSSALMDELGLEIGDFIIVWREANDVPMTSGFQVVGRVDSGGGIGDFTVFVPMVGWGRQMLGLTHFTFVEYTVADNYRIAELRRLASFFAIEGVHFTIDTVELDRVGSTLALYDMFFPVVAAALSLIGGLLPALMILQAAKEASLLRVLGTTKRRSRAMLTGQQLALCFAGLALGFLALLLYNGPEPLRDIAGTLQQCAALSGASYLAASLTCAVLVTRGNVLELLQSKE